MNKLVIAAIGQDQPGIVAAFTQVLFTHHCNVEDTSMTLLEDHFTMLIILYAPPTLTPEMLKTLLTPSQTQFGLHMNIYPIQAHAQAVTQAASFDPWMISVSSTDQSGITYHVTQYLASQKINIRHLSSKQLPREDGQVLFLMAIEADVPNTLNPDQIQSDFAALAQQEQLEIVAEKLDVYTL